MAYIIQNVKLNTPLFAYTLTEQIQAGALPAVSSYTVCATVFYLLFLSTALGVFTAQSAFRT